uniref:Riboflavin biosynthesis protein ribAB n=1 Tax=mine drainage metagenome TaxID=410659 RepID=E6QQV5_9ZZZZ
MSLSPIEDIIADIKAGKMVVLVDEEDRENEGDLVMAAQFATPDAINFMAKYGRGLICLTLTDERCRQLDLRQMVSDNQTPNHTAFTISIEAATGVTTGISAADRACTIQAAVARHAKPTDIIQPGHVFPLRAQPGGVLIRAGHTEAGCDLAALAGLEPAAVICEILKEDGNMARLPDLVVYAKEHGLKIGAIADLIHYRSQHDCLIERVGSRPISTPFGDFRLVAYRETVTGGAHLALVKGEIVADEPTLVRVHEPVSIMDALELDNPVHTFSLGGALKKINAAGRGVLVLLHRTESADDLLAHALPDNQPKTMQKWDARTYGTGAQILKDLGVGKMRLLATQRKMPSLVGFGLEVLGYDEDSEQTQKDNK